MHRFESSAHTDSFARDHLPPQDQWPEMRWDTLPELAAYPKRLNCARELLDRQAAKYGDRPVIHYNDEVWTYRYLLEAANRIAHVLVDDLGVKPGNRVLLRAPNNPMYVACWFAVMKVGAIAVATMPLYRWRELTFMADKAEIAVAICDWRLRDEMETTLKESRQLRTCRYFYAEGPESLESLMATKPATFETVDTAWDDVCLIAFTSGTTGPAKGCMHFHRDIMAICDTFSRYVLQPDKDDVFTGSPPLAFTFGLGALVTFPMHAGASTVLVEQFTPQKILETIQAKKVSVLFTAPTAYRAMTEMAKDYDIASLEKCVSAGETLPRPTWDGWRDATGIRITDGLGSTEMLHIFVTSAGDGIRPGATGKAIPGFEARVVDERGNPVPPGTVGRLAVRGPTGCRYLDNPERQAAYVKDGWNFTGDAYVCDEDGYFWYQARTDDMIVSAGYNISGPEVEAVLMLHPLVQECAVVGAPDPQRGQIVKAFVVLREKDRATAETAKLLQDFVKAEIAPYKYPRAIDFIDTLPRTQTGKVQRFALRSRDPAAA
ncbi:AMP-binding protein [Ferrovibrio xuzhouensis]|uniref:AMP-binding protein n=1 Tax=Ferrovibrio xuzhouensis TaxID=1576914 RepID=A0ABV7VNH1_9PROT